ncbi:MAG: AsmA family protein, partial [Gammaproteobacteria bacterium]
MGKLLKFTAWLLGVLVVVVVAAAILIPIFVNPNDYKPQIVALVKEKTGRNLTLQGNIKLSVFPWLGLQLGPTELSNPPGFSTEPFAKIASTELRVKLLPLLRKRVEMGTVVLDGLVLNLERNKRGTTNWADLGQTQGGAAQPAPSQTKTKGGTLPMAALAVGGVRVSDATVRWDDRQSGSRYDVKGLNLTTGAIQPGAPFDVDLRFALTGKGLPAKGVAVKLHSGVKLDLDRQTLDLNKLSLALADLKITGDVAGTQVLSAPRFRAQLAVPTFSPRRLLADLGMAAPKTADPKALDTASAQFTVVTAPGRVQVEPLTVNLDATRLAGTLGVRNFAHPSISFDLDVNKLDLDRYLPAP